jgi:hypothetical protein
MLCKSFICLNYCAYLNDIFFFFFFFFFYPLSLIPSEDAHQVKLYNVVIRLSLVIHPENRVNMVPMPIKDVIGSLVLRVLQVKHKTKHVPVLSTNIQYKALRLYQRTRLLYSPMDVISCKPLNSLMIIGP